MRELQSYNPDGMVATYEQMANNVWHYATQGVHDKYMAYTAEDGWVYFLYVPEERLYISVKSNFQERFNIFHYNGYAAKGIDNCPILIWDGTSGNVHTQWGFVYEDPRRSIISEGGIDYVKQLYKISGTSGSVNHLGTLNVDGILSDEYIRQSLLNDLLSLTLYNNIKAITPSLQTMSVITDAISESCLAIKRHNINRSQNKMQEKKKMEELIEEIRNSKLMKMLSSPWFSIALAIAVVVIAAIIAIAMIFAVVAVAIIAAIIALLAAGVVAGVILSHEAEDRAKLEKFEEALPEDLKAIFTGAISQIKDAYAEMRIMAICIVFVMAVLAIVFGVLMGCGGQAAVAKGASQASAAIRVLLTSILSNLPAMIMASQQMASGIVQVTQAEINIAVAEMEYQFKVLEASAKKLQERSKFFDYMYKRFAEAISNMLEYIESLYKAQANLIKTLGETAVGIARNIVI
jgi:uncharacterized membrane protein